MERLYYSRIESDTNRYRDILRGKARENLRNYINHSDSLVGKKGDQIVSIPVPSIELPSFRFGRGVRGVGAGEGEKGAPITPPDEADGADPGTEGGRHFREVEVTMDEIANWLEEEIELPNILPRKQGNITEKTLTSRGIQTARSNRLHFQRSYLEALKKGLSQQEALIYIDARPHARWRSYKERETQSAKAVIVHIMDASGSMSGEKKQWARITSFWIEYLIKRRYKVVEYLYILHDTKAEEVDGEAFYHTTTSGGTHISSAYELLKQKLNERYPPDDWNIFVLQFSDGENYTTDNSKCTELMKDLLPNVRFFAYFQMGETFFSGPNVNEALANQFKSALFNAQNKVDWESEPGQRRLVVETIKDRDGIYGAIVKTLGKKKAS